MLTHDLLTWIVNTAVYVGVLAFIITFISGIFGFKNPLGKIARIVGRILQPIGTWLLGILIDLVRILLRWGLRILELFFEFLVKMFRELVDIIREKRYKS